MKIFWWLLPGLKFKRYVFEFILGLIFLAVSGVLFSLWLTGDTGGSFEDNIAAQSLLYSIIALVVAILLLYFGLLGMARNIVRIVRSGGEGRFQDLAEKASRQATGPRTVVFGGGTGMRALLSGLKFHTGRLTAVITMADDGGSSGRLRHEIGALPPGDIRNCLVALSGSGPTLERVFQYRYEGEFFGGHSFGNLFITTLHRITGDFQEAVRLAGEMLNIVGQVLPSTTDKVALVATHEDGSVTTGQSEIQRTESRIQKVALKPAPSAVDEEIIRAIESADLLVFGPGSLYTSIIPNLLVPGMVNSIRRSRAVKVYVCNVLTQVGETDGFDATEHVKAIERNAGARCFDVILVNNRLVEIPSYRGGQEFVSCDRTELERLGYEVWEAELLSDSLLHDTDKVAKALMDIYNDKLSEETAI